MLAVICCVTADSVSDALRALNFSMLLACGPLVLFMRRQAGKVAAERVAQLAAIGVAIGLAEVLLSVAVPAIRYLRYNRPTGPDIGPIVFSNGLLALGFIALGALLIRRDGRAWLYVLAPLGAIAATVITGSRGPLIGVPLAVVVAAIFVWWVRYNGSRRGWIGLGGCWRRASPGSPWCCGGALALHWASFRPCSAAAPWSTIARASGWRSTTLGRGRFRIAVDRTWLGQHHGFGAPAARRR